MADTFDIVFAKEFSNFERALKDLERITMDDSGTILWKYSSQFAAQLVRHTQPRAANKKALESGQKAIRSDLARVYTSPSTIYLEIKKQQENLADAMWSQYKNNDINGLTETFRSVTGRYKDTPVVSWDGGRAHRNSRGRGGRVKGRNLSRIVVNSQADKVGQYIRSVSNKVGYTKAGWISNFNPPNGIRGIPKWVKERRGSQGRVVNNTRRGIVRGIDFYNHVSWIKDKFWQRSAEIALRSVVKRMQKDLEKAVVEASKKV